MHCCRWLGAKLGARCARLAAVLRVPTARAAARHFGKGAARAGRGDNSAALATSAVTSIASLLAALPVIQRVQLRGNHASMVKPTSAEPHRARGAGWVTLLQGVRVSWRRRSAHVVGLLCCCCK